MPLDSNIPHSDLTFATIGAAMRVHSRLGPGLKEIHYQRDLMAEIIQSGRQAQDEYFIELWDGDIWVGRLYLDLLVDHLVVVECKALPHLLTNEEIGQVICYLSATGLPVGLLLNFGRKRLEYKRILPPKEREGWQAQIGRFLWRPDSAGPLPNMAASPNLRIVKPADDQSVSDK